MTNKTLEELKREALAEAETEAAEERDRLKKILFQTNSESKINLEYINIYFYYKKNNNDI